MAPAAPRPTPAPLDGHPVPLQVRISVAVWLTAIILGAAEALVWTALPDPPAPGALAVRFTVYAVLVGLVLALRSGRDAVRWSVALLLGGVGTLSLVVEPLSWWLAGGSPMTFFAAAGHPELLIAGLRTAHVVAVAVALTLMFRPRATAFYRRSGRSMPSGTGS